MHSLPTRVKPFHVLSQGERERFLLATSLKEGQLGPWDEFNRVASGNPVNGADVHGAPPKDDILLKARQFCREGQSPPRIHAYLQPSFSNTRCVGIFVSREWEWRSVRWGNNSIIDSLDTIIFEPIGQYLNDALTGWVSR